MGRNFIDLTGKRFDRLLVVKYIGNRYWECLCDCGNVKNIDGHNLRRGSTKSCGCYNREQSHLKNQKYNIYIEKEDYYIGLTPNNIEFYFDKDDYDIIKDYRWNLNLRGYIATTKRINNKKINIRLHQLIMGKKEGCIIDHINGIKTDNRKINMRFCTQQQNVMNGEIPNTNKSGFKGVIWDKSRNKWRSYIKYNQKTITLGYFINKDDAIKTRIEAEEKYFGEYSYLNRPKEKLI